MKKILEKEFSELEDLNEFVDRNSIEFISISDKTIDKSFYLSNSDFNKDIIYYTDKKYILYYREIEEY